MISTYFVEDSKCSVKLDEALLPQTLALHAQTELKYPCNIIP